MEPELEIRSGIIKRTLVMYLTHLECTACKHPEDASRPQNSCSLCGKPLFARYDLESIAHVWDRKKLLTRPKSMWRYRELLPVGADASVVTLGEGYTPLLPTHRLARHLDMRRLFVKEESVNPTQSFKARGMSVAVSMASQFGVKKLIVPSAGNAAHALAAYAARAGLEASVFLPRDASSVNAVACRQLGARVELIDGLITDCGRAARHLVAEGWFDVSTLKEPYRIEGKKTMGIELAEQLDWRLPDVIIYPTGGGSGLLGMWKAFEELEQIGWIGSNRPRMYSVQSAGCAPILRAFESGASAAEEHLGSMTKNSGLRVPKVIGDFLILDVLRKSHGGVVGVTDEEIVGGAREFARAEGIFPSPEGAAGYVGLKKLLAQSRIGADETIVLFNTGSGVKYLEWFD